MSMLPRGNVMHKTKRHKTQECEMLPVCCHVFVVSYATCVRLLLMQLMACAISKQCPRMLLAALSHWKPKSRKE